jgi:hypothetical protein
MEVDMARNRFEQVEEVQPDAVTLSLSTDQDQSYGTVTCPAAISGGRLAADMTSDKLPAKDAFRSAIRLANEIKAPLVVHDPVALWQTEWGDLYRPVD